MVTEIALLGTEKNNTEEFERVYREIVYLIRRQPGYISDRLLHVLENEEEYYLIIEWDDLQAHKDFIDSDDFKPLADSWGSLQKSAEVRHGRLVESNSPD